MNQNTQIMMKFFGKYSNEKTSFYFNDFNFQNLFWKKFFINVKLIWS